MLRRPRRQRTRRKTEEEEEIEHDIIRRAKRGSSGFPGVRVSVGFCKGNLKLRCRLAQRKRGKGDLKIQLPTESARGNRSRAAIDRHFLLSGETIICFALNLSQSLLENKKEQFQSMKTTDHPPEMGGWE